MRTASEIDEDKRDLLRRNFPDCQKLPDFIYNLEHIIRKTLFYLGSVQLLLNKGFAATSSKVTSAICWARLGFPGACRFSTLAQVVLLISSLLLAMTAAGHGIHCRVSMHPLPVVEFYAGYVR